MDGLLTSLITNYFPNGVAYELECEQRGSCNTDQLSFKGYLHRWMAVTGQIAPFARSRIADTLKTSAQGAVSACTRGDNGRMCGFGWGSEAIDAMVGAGQEMSALSALTSLLADAVPPPCTAQTCGTSEGDASAGGNTELPGQLRPITTADRAGAGILTLLALGFMFSSLSWMSTDYFEGTPKSW